ncbi:unnamed protein product [Heligmosomoides polygyrus]|uniref:BHLH domain-containing protein n=1 Tax=Heligmosomoides polygyrus TaxID=6339 RepID=A0A183FLF9_HELPZ|nr:unnamed protein product [Heligmosomoides polygyrus]
MKREKRKYRCRKRSPATIERARIVRRDKVSSPPSSANARERRRMNSLNDALEHLRTLLPSVPEEPKMTKIETLRVAQGYASYNVHYISRDGSFRYGWRVSTDRGEHSVSEPSLSSAVAEPDAPMSLELLEDGSPQPQTVPA